MFGRTYRVYIMPRRTFWIITTPSSSSSSSSWNCDIYMSSNCPYALCNDTCSRATCIHCQSRNTFGIPPEYSRVKLHQIINEISNKMRILTRLLIFCNLRGLFFFCLSFFLLHKLDKNQKNLKQSWLLAFWKKIQNRQEIKRTLFNDTEQDKTCKFSM